MQDQDNLTQQMFDAGVRVEQMFWIAGVCASPPDGFKEFVEDDLSEQDEILAELPWLASFLEERTDAEEVLCEFAFRKVDGIFVQLATPIPRDFMKDSSGYSFTWGYYRMKWFFCRSLEEIVSKAIPWQESVVATERAKAAA